MEQPLLNEYHPALESNLIDFVSIGEDIRNWSDYNWPRSKQAPEFGVLEELGEFIHCHLKRIQGIREGATPETFKAASLDAIADTGVYLLHWCALNNYAWSYAKGYETRTTPVLVARSFRIAGSFLEECSIAPGDYFMSRVLVDHLASILTELALRFDTTLFTIVKSTWLEVRVRDWRRFPKNGKTE